MSAIKEKVCFLINGVEEKAPFRSGAEKIISF